MEIGGSDQPINNEVVKKKRGRKPKNYVAPPDETSAKKTTPKKRGRKPKGGKIVTTSFNSANSTYTISNIQLLFSYNGS